MLVANCQSAKKEAFVDRGSLFAFCGAAAVGHVANTFNFLDMSTPLQITSILPMELTVSDSCCTVSSMCICGLGQWLVGDWHRAEQSVWLGISLGAFVASEIALLCERSLSQPRAVVQLDSRMRYPM